MAYVVIPVEWTKRAFAARLAAELSPKELAAAAGVSIQLLRRLEVTDVPIRCQDTKWAAVLRALGLFTAWSSNSLRPFHPRLAGSDTSFDVFLASPMDSMADGYSQFRDVTIAILRLLKEDLKLKVYYAGESRPARADFEEPSWALRDNCSALDRTKRMLVIYPGPVPGFRKPLASSILVEVGYALARAMPVMLFYTSDLDSLPYILTSATSYLPVWRVLRYRHSEDIVAGILENRSWFQ